MQLYDNSFIHPYNSPFDGRMAHPAFTENLEDAIFTVEKVETA